jgi:hypothetical protein
VLPQDYSGSESSKVRQLVVKVASGSTHFGYAQCKPLTDRLIDTPPVESGKSFLRASSELGMNSAAR